MCEKDEFCEYGHLIEFDKQIITAGFNMFMFLYQFKEADPSHPDLLNFDLKLEKDNLFQQFQKQLGERLKIETNITHEQYAEVIQRTEMEIREEIERKTEVLLQSLNMVQPAEKMSTKDTDPKKKKKDSFLREGIDQGKKSENDLNGGAGGNTLDDMSK